MGSSAAKRGQRAAKHGQNVAKHGQSAVRSGHHRLHGDATRFDVTAAFIAERFADCRYIADVAGGQGLLSRVLNKRYNLAAEVVDPRGWVMKGVSSRQEEFAPSMAAYYDLIVGLHPDQALRPVVDAARSRPALVVPCCNFWDRSRRLGRDELLAAIRSYHSSRRGRSDHLELAFSGPHNHALILWPPVSGSGEQPHG